MEQKALGIDIGGTTIKAAVVCTGDGELLSEPSSLPLPQPATPENLTLAIQAVLTKTNWSGPIGVGYPGVVKNGRISSAAHVDKSFIGRDWLTQLRTETNSPVTLLNDADAAGIAEMRFGAGVGQNDKTVLLVTLGTGIGTALFCHGQLFPNTEFGHLQLGESEAEDQAAAAVRIKQNLDWEQYGRRVDLFLREMERLLSPDLIIIGGGITENYENFQSFLRVQARVVPATLGNNAGLIGAALTAIDR